MPSDGDTNNPYRINKNPLSSRNQGSNRILSHQSISTQKDSLGPQFKINSFSELENDNNVFANHQQFEPTHANEYGMAIENETLENVQSGKF